ncbi:hypothetical protein KY285_025451 [Solanum tuberosum]|nr:hypothetical protein KY285_025451 [Solanum tuberosum]
MAQILIKAGYDVTVWNRTKSKCKPIISLGAKYKSSPERLQHLVMSHLPCLQTPRADAACGKYGATKGIGPGKGLSVYNTPSSNEQSSQEDNQAYDEDESGDDSDSVNDSGSAMTLIA